LSFCAAAGIATAALSSKTTANENFFIQSSGPIPLATEQHEASIPTQQEAAGFPAS
jgi:hypothetical protein